MLFWWKKKNKKRNLHNKNNANSKMASNSKNKNSGELHDLKIKNSTVKSRLQDQANGKICKSAVDDNSFKAVGKDRMESKVATKRNVQKVKKDREEKKDKLQEVAAFSTSCLKLVPSNCQHIGARERQEDAFGFSDLSDSDYVEKNGVLAVVADGMGGLAKGDRASQVAVSVFLREYKDRRNEEPLKTHLLRTLHRSNTAVYDLAFTGGEDDELGTTLVAVAVKQGKMDWLSVGDSRIYHYSDGSLEQLNKEHIYANKLETEVKKGLISRKEANSHPERAFLTSYLGSHEISEVDYSEEPVILKPGDTIMLCSDGLTNTLSLDEIVEVFKVSPVNIAEELVKQALFKEKRHQDNITILVLSCKAVDEQKTKGDEND